MAVLYSVLVIVLRIDIVYILHSSSAGSLVAVYYTVQVLH